jgi:hypothetical protein
VILLVWGCWSCWRTGAATVDHLVTLPAVAMTALSNHLEQYAEPGPAGLVFPAAEGGVHAPVELPAPPLAPGRQEG